MYRPTREGDFLHELLKDFHGVLVSDFYAAYDSLDCPQQKCLIHLMRDMNQELLNNPFDEELQSITGPFGTLLRAIVDDHRPARPEAAAPGEAQAGRGQVLRVPRRRRPSAPRPPRPCGSGCSRTRTSSSPSSSTTGCRGTTTTPRTPSGGSPTTGRTRRDAEGGRAEGLPGAAEHLPDLPVQGRQLPEVPAVQGDGHGRLLRGADDEGDDRPPSRSTQRESLRPDFRPRKRASGEPRIPGPEVKEPGS